MVPSPRPPPSPAIRKCWPVAQKVLEADEEAERMRLDAEDTFAEGERHMSTAMAREGAGKALATYDLHEKAIRKAEAAARTK